MKLKRIDVATEMAIAVLIAEAVDAETCCSAETAAAIHVTFLEGSDFGVCFWGYTPQRNNNSSRGAWRPGGTSSSDIRKSVLLCAS